MRLRQKSKEIDCSVLSFIEKQNKQSKNEPKHKTSTLVLWLTKQEYKVTMELLEPNTNGILSKAPFLISIQSLTNENHNTVPDSSPQRLR